MQIDATQTDTCLVLMFKSPQHSKRRLAAQIGTRAATAAAHLLECAAADLAAWRGPTCLAPAAAADSRYARDHGIGADTQLLQRGGNLGERIGHLNAALLAAGLRRQLFIGSDCPALDGDYLERAAAALAHTDVVLGPADDGGVVLMGIDGRWPALAALPWSSAELGAALQQGCEAAGLGVTLLDSRSDVDALTDLRRLPVLLEGDQRASRRRLCEWILSEPMP